EGDMVHRPSALAVRRKLGRRLDVDDVGAITAVDPVTRQLAIMIDRPVAHELQQLGCRTSIAKSQRDTAKAVKACLFRNRATAIGRTRIAGDLDQGETVAVGTEEAEPPFAEALVLGKAVYAGAGEALLPVSERTLGHGKGGFGGLAC